MSTELERTVEDSLVARAGVHALLDAAEQAQTPHEAREVMLKGKLVADLLQRAKAPFEDAQIAGKASTIAARKLGRLISEADSKPRIRHAGKHHRFNGTLPSARGVLTNELGLGKATRVNLMRLAKVEDPDFQRYIQDKTIIPSVSGALRVCNPYPNDLTQRRRTHNGDWRSSRRRKAGVKTPKNPSVDEAYSLIVRALGHLTAAASSIGGSNKRRASVTHAIDILYQAEDTLRTFKGGYVE